MKIWLLKLLLLVILTFFSFGANGQQHNFGLYVKVAVEGDEAIYERVWSMYEPEVNNEPILPTDIHYVPPTLPECNPDTGICNELQGSPGETQESRSISITGGAQDRIRISCGPLCNQMSGFMFRLSFAFQGGGGGLGDFDGENFLREALESHFEGLCDNAEFVSDIPLTEEQRQALFSFLNGPAAQALWNASNFRLLTRERREQAGFLLPDGTFQLANVVQNGPCHVQISDTPGSWPDGTIVVHTHPWARGEFLEACGDPGRYQNVASNRDRTAVGFHLDDVNGIGLILDADGFILFTPTADSEFHEGSCGFMRTQP